MLIKLLFDGGIFFTGPIFIIFLSCLILTVLGIKKANQHKEVTKKIKLINSLGLFALIFGILGQLLSLMEGLRVIKLTGGIFGSMLTGGFFVSFISTLLGLITFLTSKSATTYLSYLQNNTANKK